MKNRKNTQKCPETCSNDVFGPQKSLRPYQDVLLVLSFESAYHGPETETRSKSYMRLARSWASRDIRPRPVHHSLGFDSRYHPPVSRTHDLPRHNGCRTSMVVALQRMTSLPFLHNFVLKQHTHFSSLRPSLYQ